MKAKSITLAEPVPREPVHERYSGLPFPPYRFVPGRSAHPRRDRRGHSFGQGELRVEAFNRRTWPTCEAYLYGVDLYNQAYWWECHEQWEAIWKHVGARTDEGRFLQGLIQVAAANLRRFMGSHKSGATLARKGLEKLDIDEGLYLGIAVLEFRREVESYFAGDGDAYPLISLSFPSCDLP